MNRILVFLLFLFSLGCSEFHDSYKPSNKELIVNEILNHVARELRKNEGLQPCGDSGQMMDQIKMLALSFDYRGPIEIDRARELLIKSVDVLVDAVNADERVRPYLNNYPFEPTEQTI